MKLALLAALAAVVASVPAAVFAGIGGSSSSSSALEERVWRMALRAEGGPVEAFVTERCTGPIAVRPGCRPEPANKPFPRLAARGDDRLRMTLGSGAGSVSVVVTLRGNEREVTVAARPRDGARRRWDVRLPAEAEFLSIKALSATTDAGFIRFAARVGE